MSEPAVVKAPFEDAPCQCVRRHSPVPLEIEKHHVYPQGMQVKRHGKVIDKETVPLCDVAHKNVHIALTKRLRGEPFRLWNRYQESIVEAGLGRSGARDDAPTY